MTAALDPSAPAVPGRRLLFVHRAIDAPPSDPSTDVVVLDTTWTPCPTDRPDLSPIRTTFHTMVVRVDLFDEMQTRIDAWALANGLADHFTVDGVSWWFRVRMIVRWHLHERMIWCHVLDMLLGPEHTWIEVPANRPALVDAARAAALSRRGLYVEVAAATEPVDSTPTKRQAGPRATAPGGLAAAALLRRLTAGVRRLASGLRRRIRRIAGLPPSKRDVTARRRAVLEKRIDGLMSQPPAVLALASANFFQVIQVDGHERFADPHLALVMDRLGGEGVPVLTVALASDHRSDADWAFLAEDDHLLPYTAVHARWSRKQDEAIDAREVAVRVAAMPDVPLEVAGCDLGPSFRVVVAEYTGPWLEGQLRRTRVAERLMRDLRPRVLLTDHEGVRTSWLAAARRVGVPVVAVQHGVIHSNNGEYCHPRPPELVLPDLTCVYGTFERDVLLELGGYRPSEVVVTGSSRADPEHSRLSGSATERDDVRRELGVVDGDRMLVVSVAHSPVAGDIYSVEWVSRALGGPLPGIHVVFKLHPRERGVAPYEAVLEGLARAGGYAPPTMTSVRDFDLFRLLRSADAHIGLYSTVLTDAVVAGAPNLLVTGQAYGDLLGYVQGRVATPVATPDDVRAFMVDPRPPDPADREAFLAEHFLPGDATGRIVGAIRSMVDLRRYDDG